MHEVYTKYIWGVCMVKTIWLKRARTVRKSGGASHIYLPDELLGSDVVGIIIRSTEKHENDTDTEEVLL